MFDYTEPDCCREGLQQFGLASKPVQTTVFLSERYVHKDSEISRAGVLSETDGAQALPIPFHR